MAKIKTNDSAIVIIRRALSEFLLLPSVIIVLFLCLAFVSSLLDQERVAGLRPARQFLQHHIFSNPEATSNLLSAIVSGTISVTTLTTTLLLVIVQQSAGSMTAQVFDQFLRRKTNQFYLGFFVGLALYSMIILATVNKPFNPVWGGTIAFCLTALALYFLVLLMYTTINQMRPAEIINAIYNRTVAARERQLTVISYTRPIRETTTEKTSVLLCEKGGYVTDIDTGYLADFISKHCPESQVIFPICIGDYIAYGEELAVIVNGQTHETIIKQAILKSMRFDIQRDIDFDAAYGITQIETIAWTSVSTAHSNPAPGISCVNVMHNLLGVLGNEKTPVRNGGNSPVKYTDNVFEALMGGFENLLVISSESMQHQVFAAILNTITVTIDKLAERQRARMRDIVLLSLSVMGDHALTRSLDKALTMLQDKLHCLGDEVTAHAVEEAHNKLHNSLGKLNSRSTRV